MDPQVFASVRPTLDPLTLTPLRNAVMHSAWGRGKIDLPPGIAKKLYDTPVFVGAAPGESRFRKDLAKSLRVERVSDNARNQKLNIKDERQEVKQADNGRKQEDKQVQQQARQVEQQQRKQEGEQKKVERKAAPQPQGQRVGNPAKPNPEPRIEHQPAPQVNKHEMKQQGGGGQQKAERKQGPPAQPGGQGQGGGKGKGKGKP